MFATVLYLCSFAACNGYFVDKADTEADCMKNLVSHSDQMAIAWAKDDRSLQAFLDKNKIKENIKVVTVYDYTCEFIPDHDIP